MINMKPKIIVDQCTQNSLKHNYVLFVDEYGFDLANEKLESLFGGRWHKHKTDVWQWYDREYDDR